MPSARASASRRPAGCQTSRRHQRISLEPVPRTSVGQTPAWDADSGPVSGQWQSPVMWTCRRGRTTRLCSVVNGFFSYRCRTTRLDAMPVCNRYPGDPQAMLACRHPRGRTGTRSGGSHAHLVLFPHILCRRQSPSRTTDPAAPHRYTFRHSLDTHRHPGHLFTPGDRRLRGGRGFKDPLSSKTRNPKPKIRPLVLGCTNTDGDADANLTHAWTVQPFYHLRRLGHACPPPLPHAGALQDGRAQAVHRIRRRRHGCVQRL